MNNYKYLIIGGGITSLSAAAGIRQRDPKGSVGIISAESNLPYARPPLSKGLWQGATLDSIWLKQEAQQVELMLRRRVLSIDTRARTVTDSQKGTTSFDRLLIATGSHPKPLPFGGNHIIYFRTLDDYRKLRALADEKRRFAIIGGSFLAAELAAGLVAQGRQVVMIFPEPGIFGRLLPLELAQV